MNDIDFKDKSSSRMPGKEIVIALVVVFSSLTFVLGYYVGKSGRRPDALPPAAESNQPQVPQTQPPRSPADEAAMPVNTQPAENAETSVRSETVPAEEVREPAGGPEEKAPKKAPREAHAESRGEPAKKTVPKENAASAKADRKGGLVYTVQVAALKDEPEAEKLKAKLEQKGYPVYITIAKGAKNEKIYKVRAGEYGERKDAEILSIKIKKTEGASPFVTFK